MMSVKVWAAKLSNKLPDKIAGPLSSFVVNKIIKKYANLNIKGYENIDNLGESVIFICNHLSNADGLVLNKALERKNVTFIAGVKLSKDPFTNIGMRVVKTIVIKPNTADKEALTAIVKTVKGGNSILIFPEGTRSRSGSMIKGKKGILLIAKLTGAKLVPIGLSGTEEMMPISKSEDMSSEKFKNADISINIGEPFTIPKREDKEDKELYEERALNFLMSKIAELLPEKYRGVYSNEEN